MKLICVIEPIGRRASAEYYRKSFGLDIFRKYFDEILLMGHFPEADIYTRESKSIRFGLEGRKIFRDMKGKDKFAVYCAPIYWGPYMTKGLGIKTFVRYGLSINNLKICRKDGCNHSHYARYILAKHLRNRFWHGDVYFIAVSKFLHAELLKLGVRRSRAAQIYAVPDTRIYSPGKSHETEKMRFVYAIQDLKQERKRPETIMEAAKLLDEETLDKIDFLCTGYNNEWFSKILGNMKKHFTLPGVVQTSKMIEIYRGSYYGLHPTITEGFPRAILEGMSCGLPFIAQDIEGISEIVNSENGYLFKTPEEMAKIIYDVVKDQKKRKKLGARSRKDIIRLEKVSLKKYDEFFTRAGVA